MKEWQAIVTSPIEDRVTPETKETIEEEILSSIIRNFNLS